MSSIKAPTSLLLSSMLALSGCYQSRSTGGGDVMKVQEIRFDKISDEPRLSPPDSDFTAFGQSTKKVTDEPDVEEHFNIMIMNNLGLNRKVVTSQGSYLGGPAWSPDAKRLYFASELGISVVPAAEGGIPGVIVSDTGATELDVSPDGNSLVYAVKDGRLKLVELSNPPVLKELGISGKSPRYSPDGKTLAFGANKHINLLNFATGEVTDAYDCRTELASASWFPDGERMAVTTDAGLVVVTLGTPPTYVMMYEQLATKNVDVAKDGKFMIFTIVGDTSMLALSEY
jgi:Tol biopolymer transport system component